MLYSVTTLLIALLLRNIKFWVYAFLTRILGSANWTELYIPFRILNLISFIKLRLNHISFLLTYSHHLKYGWIQHSTHNTLTREENSLHHFPRDRISKGYKVVFWKVRYRFFTEFFSVKDSTFKFLGKIYISLTIIKITDTGTFC